MNTRLQHNSSKIPAKLVQKSLPQEINSIPLYGPLNITDAENFKKEQREYLENCFYVPTPDQMKIENFNILCLIGKGAFGKVYLVLTEKPEKIYAMKMMKKEDIVKHNQVSFALNEKRVLQSLNFPFCIRLQFLAQDEINLYWFMPFISGGEMFTHLKKLKQFNEELSRFYAGQVILALEFLHYCNLVYRDLKPENVLIDHTGYIKVSDFGFTKEVKNRLYTFCGTPDYIAPEIVLGLGHSKAVDYWALGVLIYEMGKGKTPFDSENEMERYKNILSVKYEMPTYFSEDLQDLIKHLLRADVTQRYGHLQNGVSDIKQHQWFAQINWLALLNRTVTPPYIPEKLRDIMTLFPDAKTVTMSLFASDGNSSEKDYDKYFKDF